MFYFSVYLNCSSEWQNTHIYKDASHIPPMRGKRQSFATVSDSKSMYMQRRKRAGKLFFVKKKDKFH